MKIFKPALSFLIVFHLMSFLHADALRCDMTGYSPQAGLQASLAENILTASWQGDPGMQLRAQFGVQSGSPVIAALSVQKGKGAWQTLGRNLRPEFGVTTGVRRSGHDLPEEKRWDVYWDAPLSVPGAPTGNPDLPRKPEEVRRFTASYQTTSCRVKSDGARLEILFSGVSMGIFAGDLQFTIYRGTNLMRMEVIAKTEESSVAYKYYGGLKGFSTDTLDRVEWRDTGGNAQQYRFGGAVNSDPVPLRARNRVAILSGSSGSLAVFPPPHQFFFARQLEINLGFVWYRKDGETTFSAGIRHGENHEGYNPAWIQQVFALYNAPPGTWQRMAVYFYPSAEPTDACREAALAFTHGDRFKPVPGYKTLATHFHTAFTQELMDSKSLDTQPGWIPSMRSLGVNIAFLCDFHGDGHPRDAGPVRLRELENYFAACRRHSDREFLIVPGEEPNEYFGGHYNLLFPRPVYWTHVRRPDQPLAENDPRLGTVYHAGSAGDLLEILKRENGLVWQTHPRTKGSTFYPDRIRDKDYFLSDHWLGAAFKALPVDLSQRRLCEERCFGTLDDMNNWNGPKYLVAEVDTYKKFPDYDLYGDFNINYVKLDRLPDFNDWGSLGRALRAGDFFVSTGEVLIRKFSLEGTGSKRALTADLEWTFPLDFVEVVWSDGQKVERQIISTTAYAPFGSHLFQIPFDTAGKKWIRFAAWDSAGNGAFTQPVFLSKASTLSKVSSRN